MCPACLTAAAILAAKIASAGGLTVFAATQLRARAKTDRSIPHLETQEIYEPIKSRIR